MVNQPGLPYGGTARWARRARRLAPVLVGVVCGVARFSVVRALGGYSRAALASHAATALGNALGWAGVVGGAMRTRLCSAWAVPGTSIVRVVGFGTLTMIVGVVAVTGIALSAEPARTGALMLPVFDMALMALLGRQVSLAEVTGALVVCRAVLFLVPLALAVVLAAGLELHLRRMDPSPS